jgi:NADH:ubiquinone oxidoreductase subunit 6 (subunit J)
MIAALFISGCVLLVVAAVFFWLNCNSPIQTSIPAYSGAIGVALLFLAFGGVVL